MARKLQTGGYVQYNPLPVEVPLYHVQSPQFNPELYAPIAEPVAPKPEMPDFEDAFKGVDGYTNEKKEIIGKAYGAYTKLKDYLEENKYAYNTDYAKRLMKEMMIDPAKKQELINNWKLGQEAEKSIGQNKSENQWIRNGKGEVLVSDGQNYKWIEDTDATVFALTTGNKPVTVGQARIERNEAEALKWDSSVHTGMRETVGLPMLNEYIERLKADGKISNKWDNEQLRLGLAQMSTADGQAIISGVTGSSGLRSDNERAYQDAVASAYEQIKSDKGYSNAIRTAILNNITNGKLNATVDLLTKAGLDNNLTDILQDKQQLNKLIEIESKLFISNQLNRHLFRTTEQGSKINPYQWITDKAGGAGEYQKVKTDFWANMLHNHNLIDFKSKSEPMPGDPTKAVNVKVAQIPGTAMEGASKFNGSTVASLQNADVIFQGQRINDEMTKNGVGNKNVIVVSQGANGDGEAVYHYDYKNKDFQTLESSAKQIESAITKAKDPQELASLRAMAAEIEKAKQYYGKVYIRAKMYVDPSDIENMQAFKKGDITAINGFAMTGKTVDPTYNGTVSLIDDDKVPDIVKDKVANTGWFSGKVAVVDVEVEKGNSWYEDPASVRQEYTPPNAQYLKHKSQQVLRAIALSQAKTPN